MKITYITAKTPFGPLETFILTEMLALKELGVNLIIIPRDKSHELFHKKAETLLEDTLIVPWFNIKIARTFLTFIINNLVLFLKLINDIVFKARNIKIAIKNLFILPKALYISKFLKGTSTSHIHAHWGSTTSTMAYIVSKTTGIPWSFTTHRWDIKENNLLKLKINAASFTRCISEHGKKMILDISGREYEHKIKIIPMGVELIESTNFTALKNNPFTIAVPANLYPVKGHKYLIDACSILKKRGIEKLKCFFYGDGHLENELKRHINKIQLNDCVIMPGRISNCRKWCRKQLRYIKLS